MNTIRAKAAIITAEMEFNNYFNRVIEYGMYCNLPWYKKLFTKAVQKPNFYHHNRVVIHHSITMIIELRLYYYNERREVTLAINEDNRGYILNVDTLEKRPYLGKVRTNISEDAKILLMEIRNELAPLIVE